MSWKRSPSRAPAREPMPLYASPETLFSSCVDAVLYIDGGCSGNTIADISRRQMTACVTSDTGEVLVRRERAGGSNNCAELWALVEALVWANEHGLGNIEIRTDSRNNLSWGQCRPPGLEINDRELVLNLQSEILALRKRLMYRLVWVPREQNLAGIHLETVGRG